MAGVVPRVRSLVGGHERRCLGGLPLSTEWIWREVWGEARARPTVCVCRCVTKLCVCGVTREERREPTDGAFILCVKKVNLCRPFRAQHEQQNDTVLKTYVLC